MAGGAEREAAGAARAGPGMAAAALALLAALFVAINALSSAWLTSARLDLTADRLYTLSDSTLDLLERVSEPVVFRLYLSAGLAQVAPSLGVYASRVRDLLREYESVSGGMVRLEVLDPEPFSDVEDRAVAAGLEGVPATAGGENLYFGLVGTNATDDIETVPFMRLDREAFLEYDLSRMLYALTALDAPKVGVLSSLPTDGTMRMTATGTQEQVPPWVIRTQIGELFETRFLGAQADEIPEDIDVLLVVHPRNATPRTRFAIDQFVMAGGKAMVFVDPFSEAEGMQGQMLGTVLDGSALPESFAAWGLEFGVDTVVADRLTARKVVAQDSDRLLEYVPWLELRGPNIDRESPITSGVDTVAVASAGYLKLRDGAPVAMDPLLTSSPGSALAEAAKVQGFRDPARLLREYEPTGERYVLAARISGMAPSGFPEGPPVAERDEDDEAPAEPPWTRPVLAESREPLDVLVVGDSDILADRFWVVMSDFVGGRIPTPTANNGDFVLNAIEALAGSSALLDLRGRGAVSRPFEVLLQIQREAARKFEDKERELRETLEKTERDLRELRLRNPDAAAVVPERDRRAMARFQRDILRLRAELREVRRSLNEDFERLEARLWFLNIAAAPIAVTALAILLGVWRVARRRDRAHEAAAG